MNTFRNGDKTYTLSDIERLEQQLAKANERVAELELVRIKEAALVMANARRIIKRTTMSNARLFMELHGSGMGKAIDYCRNMLGINYEDNKTCYSDMMVHIEQLHKEQEND